MHDIISIRHSTDFVQHFTSLSVSMTLHSKSTTITSYPLTQLQFEVPEHERATNFIMDTGCLKAVCPEIFSILLRHFKFAKTPVKFTHTFSPF